MTTILYRRLALLAVFSVSACAGGGTANPVLSVAPQSAQATTQTVQSRTLSDKDKESGKNDKGSARYSGQIQDLMPPCGQPSFSCTGAFAVALDRDGNSISGTWTQDFTNPPLHDQGTFSGSMTGHDTFTATFSSPTDGACTITVSGTLTPSEIDATYVYDADCGVVDHGSITLDKGKGKGDKGGKD